MQKKKVESIWTKDITPGVVNFMTQDITPDFSGDLWTKDITHHIVGTLAVFGLVVSSFVATLGVAAVGVNVELAFAQQAAASQTAAALMAENHPPLPQRMQEVKGEGRGMDMRMASGTMAVMASSTKPFCPLLTRAIGRGVKDATSTGEVSELQRFIANHFGLDDKDVVTGYFGSTTEGYLKKFQKEQGIPPASVTGPLTRVVIYKLCGSGKERGKDDRRMGTSTTIMGNPPVPPHREDMRNGSTTIGSTTPPGVPMPHRDDMRAGSTTNIESHGRPLPPPPPLPTTPPTPVSYNDNSSNTASIIEAVNQIGDGYNKLLMATLSIIGL